MMSFVSITVILFLLMDSFGNIASFLYMTEGLTPQRKRIIILREMAIALLAMLFFWFIGEFLISLLNVSLTTVEFSSAVILFLTAIKILFPASDSLRANLPKEEPFVTPFAIPLIAGPSLLATIMLFAHLEPNNMVMFGAIMIAWIASLLVMLASPWISKVVGFNGLMAGERLMGMILVLLAIQRFFEGLHAFILKCAQ